MSEPQQADGKAAMNALDALRFDWGSAYEITGDGDQWRARRLDEIGGWIEATDPDALRNEIISDYTLKPVRFQDSEANPNV
jgi:hypothetical protein